MLFLCYNKIVKILFVAAEVAPFVSVGGLSQVMYFLPRALNELGHDVRVFTPKYGKMDKTAGPGKTWELQMEHEALQVPLKHTIGHHTETKQHEVEFLQCNVKRYMDKKKSIHAYFLENREYYELRANVFGYLDDHIRFSLLSKGCLEWLLQRKKEADKETGDKQWWPDVIHCNDWHTAYVIEMARKDRRYQQLFAKTSIVLTVHNFAFQGNYDYRFAAKEDKDDGTKPLEPILSPGLQKQNALLRGLLNADAVNTVSPSHAVEILTPEYAEGLETYLHKIRSKLTGILNGIDVDEFDPSNDPIIKKQFTEKNFMKARRENKMDLQKRFLLPVDPERPLLAFSGRLSSQKGLDLLIQAIEPLFAHRPDVQLIVLGGGDDRYRNKLTELQKLYPEQLALHLQPDFRLPRKIFAGSDIFLVPSFFEPGGIVALEALRYGTVPLVRRTGGLGDIIDEFDPEKGKGNGFCFVKKDPWALFAVIIEALTLYKQQSVWKKLVLNCLQCDFSWVKAAKHYDIWYKHVIEERRRATSLIPHPAYVASLDD